MRMRMRAIALLVAALGAALFACKSEQVVAAKDCSDACCSGNPLLIDCGEHPDIMCTESGDPCTAQAYGCTGGVFFEMAQASLPAMCTATDGAPDATTEDDGPGTLFGGDAATDGGPDDATTDGAPDALGASDAAGALDAADANVDAGTLFVCGDASCSAAAQYCRHTVGDGSPGDDTLLCQPLDQGQSICADASSQGCQCGQDAGGLYVQCGP
jgi:hypothetical protein